MPTPTPSDRAALGRERLAARARRIANLRRRVVAATLASFALAWGVIAFNGPMGVAAQTTTTPTATTDSSSNSSSSDTTSSPAVTTSQS